MYRYADMKGRVSVLKLSVYLDPQGFSIGMSGASKAQCGIVTKGRVDNLIEGSVWTCQKLYSRREVDQIVLSISQRCTLAYNTAQTNINFPVGFSLLCQISFPIGDAEIAGAVVEAVNG